VKVDYRTAPGCKGTTEGATSGSSSSGSSGSVWIFVVAGLAGLVAIVVVVVVLKVRSTRKNENKSATELEFDDMGLPPITYVYNG
jgi:hypothetical protein